MLHINFMARGGFFFARARVGTRSRLVKIALIFSAFFAFPQNTLQALDKQLQKSVAKINSQKLDDCLPAIETLGRSRNGEVIAPLAQAYAVEQRALVRRYIVDALGMMGSRQAQPALLQALNDSDSQVRQSAVVALANFPDDVAQNALVNRVDSENDIAVKANLAQALGRSKHRDAGVKLDKLSKDADPRLCQIAQDENQKRSKKRDK